MKKKIYLKLLDILKSNCVVSLISDAGTPAISDPGAILINECIIKILIFFQYLEHQQYRRLSQ